MRPTTFRIDRLGPATVAGILTAAAPAAADWSSDYAEATLEHAARAQATVEAASTSHPDTPPASPAESTASSNGHWATATAEATYNADEEGLRLSARSHAIVWQSGDGTGDVEADSRASIAAMLELDAETTIRIDGDWEQANDCWWKQPYIEATLANEAGDEVWRWNPPPQDDCESPSDGDIEIPDLTLGAGLYRLELSVESRAADACSWDPKSGWENWCEETDLESPWSNWFDATFAASIEFTMDAATPGDLNGDGQVNGADLGLLFTAWGTSDAAADLNADGIVNGEDLGILFTNYG